MQLYVVWETRKLLEQKEKVEILTTFFYTVGTFKPFKIITEKLFDFRYL